jgi:hypothetical protein
MHDRLLAGPDLVGINYLSAAFATSPTTTTCSGVPAKLLCLSNLTKDKVVYHLFGELYSYKILSLYR